MSDQVHDPYRGPLFEIRVCLLADLEISVHVSFDLLMLDARSLMHVLREWGERYRDAASAEPVNGASFREFVLARQRREVGRKSDIEEMKRRAALLAPGPSLPLAVAPSTVGRPRFRRHQARLDREQVRVLQEKARARKVTMSALVGAAFAEVLALYSEERSFTLTLTAFDRPNSAVGPDVVGEFTTLLLVPVSPSEKSFDQRVSAFSRSVLDALEQRDTQGLALLREHALVADAHNRMPRPLAPVVFTSLLNEDSRGLTWLGEPQYAVSQTPQVWLDHQAMLDHDGVNLSWDVVEDLFPDGLIDEMFATYLRLLQTLVRSDGWEKRGRELAGLPTLAAIDAEPEAETLYGAVERQVARTPDALAVLADDRRLTYRELWLAARMLSHHLCVHDVGRGDRVAVVVPKGWQQIAAVLGVLGAGAAYVPLDPNVPLARQAELIHDSEAKVVVGFGSHHASAGFEGLVVDLRGFWRDGIDAPEPLPQLDPPSPEDLAYLIYTSGSTGRPKAVAIEHRSALNTLTDVNDRFGVAPDDRVLSVTALTFDLSVYDIFGSLVAGAAIVVPDPDRALDPRHWARLMQRERVTIWNSVPALFWLLWDSRDAVDADPMSHLRLVMLSGDWISVKKAARVRRELPEVRLVSLGGATEASVWSVLYDVADVDERWKSLPYGKAMRGQAALVLDDNLEPRPVWVPGELSLAGAGLAREYWHAEPLTSERFPVQPNTGQRLYRTGDLARLLPDGNLELLGRIDDQLKVNGHRIEPGEVEAILLRHPAVTAAVAGAEGPREGPRRLIAYVQPSPSHSESSTEVQLALRHHMNTLAPAFLVPDEIRIVPGLPLTPNGKIDRGRLFSGQVPAATAEPTTSEDAATNRTSHEIETERQLLDVVTKVFADVSTLGDMDLNLASVDQATPLADLALPSIAVLELLSRLDGKLGGRPGVADFYAMETVGDLLKFYEVTN